MDKPLQQVSYAQKKAKNWEHCKKTMDYYLGHRTSREVFSFSQSDDKAKIWLDAYYGDFPAADTSFVENPMNSTDDKLTRWPAKLRKLNLIKPNVDQLLGEFIHRNFQFTVENYSPDSYNEFLEALQEEMVANQMQHFTAKLGMNPSPDELPEQVQQRLKVKYKDQLAIKGQRFLTRVEKRLEMHRKQCELFFDYLVAGRCLSYKSVEDGQVVYENMSPFNCQWEPSGRSPYVEDAEWVVSIRNWQPAEVVQRFWATLKGEDIKVVEEAAVSWGSREQMFGWLSDNKTSSGVEVVHVCWRSFRKVTQLMYIDPLTGELQEDEYEEHEQIPAELKAVGKIRVFWKPQIWEGWRIAGKIYTDIGPLPGNKMPYNGMFYANRQGYSDTSFVSLCYHYNLLYIILNFRLELTIARSKGKVVLLDKRVIPDMDEVQFIYYAEATGYGFIDRNQPGADKSYNQYQVLDLSLYQHISELINVIQYVKGELEELTGINRQRKGQSMASDGKAVTERAIFQGSTITEWTFYRFNAFQEREYQGMLDLAPYCEAHAQAIWDEAEGYHLYEFLPEDFVHASVGVFAVGGSAEREKMQQIQQAALGSLVAGGALSQVVKLMNAKSITELSVMMEGEEEKQQLIQQQMQEMQAKMQEQMEQLEQQRMAFQEELKRETMHEEYDRKEIMENMKVLADGQKHLEKEFSTRNKMLLDAQKEREKNQVSQQQIQSNERIAQGDQQVALKNKVAGEK